MYINQGQDSRDWDDWNGWTKGHANWNCAQSLAPETRRLLYQGLEEYPLNGESKKGVRVLGC